MKRIFNILMLLTVLFAGTSCKKYFDINDNPNQPTAATPQLVLPSALAGTAFNLGIYNNYGAWVMGYAALGGGLNGYAEERTYNYTRNFYGSGAVDNTIAYRYILNLWDRTWRNLEDYQYIIDVSEGDATLAYYNAVAKIMKAYNYQMLVDEYGDLPYSEALKGAENITPKYDKAEDIYQDLVNQIDEAIALLQTTDGNSLGGPDIMFGGSNAKWLGFANSLRLKILIRISGVSSLSSFVNEKMASFNTGLGFLDQDAIVNPGYSRTDGKQNPYWERYHSSASGSYATGTYPQYTLPTHYIYGFYNGDKLADNVRGGLIYRNFPNTPVVQLGEPNPVEASGSQIPAWYVGSASGVDYTTLTGVLKGPSAGVPIMLLAESDFVLAEANLKGYLNTGSASNYFDEGIRMSFQYLYKNAAAALTKVESIIDTEVEAYKAANSSFLVNYNSATTDAQRLQAIITQKYIALNMIHGHEAWSEYRRTGYPANSSNPTGNAVNSFVSLQSASTRPDRLPVRLLYPTSESYNQANVPTGITPFSPTIFWDVN